MKDQFWKRGGFTPDRSAPTALQLNYFGHDRRPGLRRRGGGDVRPAMEMRDMDLSPKSGGRNTFL